MNGILRASLALASALAAASAAWGQSPPPAEHFARAPNIDHAALSPNGDRVAFVAERDGQPVLLVVNVETGATEAAVSTGTTVARSVGWASDEDVILIVSETERLVGYRGQLEFVRALAVTLTDTPPITRPLLPQAEDGIDLQTNLAGVVGVDWDRRRVIMQALSDGELDLFAVNPENSRRRIRGRGGDLTHRWILDENGDAIVRLSSTAGRTRQIIEVADGARWRRPSGEETIPMMEVAGLAPTGDAVAVFGSGGPNATRSVLSLNPETGDFGTGLFMHDRFDVQAAILDPYTNRVIGVVYHDVARRTHWFDEEMDSLQQSLEEAFGGAMVEISSWSRDRRQILARVQDEDMAPAWYRVDRDAGAAELISPEYPELAAVDLPVRRPYRHPARDGTEIPGYLTLPPGADDTPLPLVVFPHGGPAARDVGGFDAIAHFIASRGYAVFQPNFRGSVGYGDGFTEAGYGGWGRGVMQHDVTDGVQALITQGRVDPDRICIVGASYGGYAALAGAAFTPDLYACAAAIAPAAELRSLLRWVRERDGPRHWTFNYWRDVIGGDGEFNNTLLDSLSPAANAEAITASVLLMHGRNDTVVPIEQSFAMRDALERAGADVTFIELRGEDHWLSRSDTRLELFLALETFLSRHLD